MKTLGEVLQLSVKYLQDLGETRPRRVAEEIFSHLLKLDRIHLYMQFDRPIQEEELGSLREWLRRKGRGEPLEYLLKEVEFFHCRLLVTPSVLIPRPETELLLDKVCAMLQSEELRDKTVLDLCCGSGCLGIGLKKKFPELKLFLSDLSWDALEVAKKNCIQNGVEAEFLQGDLLEPFQEEKADLILCNPPYVSEAEYLLLDKSVRDYEPRGALVGGKNGLEFYERLARQLPLFLSPRGRVFFEIGKGQGERVLELFSSSCWKEKSVTKDFAGRDRFFFLEIE